MGLKTYAEDSTPPTTADGSSSNLSYLLNKQNKFFHVFKFLEKSYGSNIELFFKALETVLGVASQVRIPKTKKIRIALNLLRFGIPASYRTVEFALKLKDYISNLKNEELSVYGKLLMNFRKLLEIPEMTNMENYRINVGESILFWILSNPETKSFKVLNYFNETKEKLDKIVIEKETIVLVLIEYKGEKLIWCLEFTKMMDIPVVNSSRIYIACKDTGRIKVVRSLENDIILDYIRSFNIKENVLLYDSHSIKGRPRVKVTENINQVDVEKYVKEMKFVLSSGKRRGYAFIGLQGTGKSLIIRKIEEMMTDEIILHLSPDRFFSVKGINQTFEIIRNLQALRLIVVMEDFDSFNFETKSERVGAFINEMDSVTNAVFIATINETSKLHATIIDRPERFDEVIEVVPPKNVEEIYTIMNSKFRRCCGTPFFGIEEIQPEIIQTCLKNKFSQAGIASIIYKTLILLEDKVDSGRENFNMALAEAVLAQQATSKTLATYDFSNKCEEFYDDECEKAEESPVYMLKSANPSTR